MMKIEEIVGDIVLIVLENYDPLKKIGINQDKIFVEVKGYDENGIWIHHPKFAMPKLDQEKVFRGANAHLSTKTADGEAD